MGDASRMVQEMMMNGASLSGMAKELLSNGFETEEVVRTLRSLRGREVPIRLVVGAMKSCGVSEDEVSEILARIKDETPTDPREGLFLLPCVPLSIL